MLSEKLKLLREDAGLPQRKLVAALDIDIATYSKIENGLFLPKKEQVIELSHFLDYDEDELLKLWMTEKRASVTKNDKDLASDALKMVQESLK